MEMIRTGRSCRRVATAIVTGLVTGLVTAVALIPTARAFGQGGEDAASAVPIEMDLTTAGTTAGYADDALSVGCDFFTFPSPDVFYVYVPAVDHDLTVAVWETTFTSQVYVRDVNLDVVQQRNGFAACNTDGCDGGGSQVDCVPVTAGETYYVVVDTDGITGGTYEITLSETPPDDPACVACIVDTSVGTPEPPDCGFGDPGHVDDVNGGCDVDPPVFTPIACGETVCARSWRDGATFDSDWFQFSTSAPTLFTVEVSSEFDAIVWMVTNDGEPDCEGTTSWILAGGQPCAANPGSRELPPGTHWLRVHVAHSWQILDCDDDDADYCLTLTCEPVGPCPTDFNTDGLVAFTDLLAVLSNWGPCPAPGGGNPVAPPAAGDSAPAGPCAVACQPGDIVEPDDCMFGEVPDDTVNGGCYVPPDYPMSPLACGDTFCGTAYFDGTYRDTDWFRVVATEPTRFMLSATCEFDSVIGRIETFGIDDCTRPWFAEFSLNEPCDPTPLVSPVLDPGVYFYFIAPAFSTVIDCTGPDADGEHYRATLDCVIPSLCPWDIDVSGVVGFEDLLRVLADWGPCPGE